MDKGIYTALSGALAKSHELEVLANNLANVNTTAFKADQGTFNEYLPELRRPDTVQALDREIKAETLFEGRVPGDKSFVEMDGVYTNFSQGTLRRTGRALDLGIEGKGFFEVLTPEGVRYTRSGNLKLSDRGLLVTAQGNPVLANLENIPPEERVIQIRDVVSPEQRTISINESALMVSSDGIISQGEIQLNVIALREFHEPQWLEKVGNGLYRNNHPENLVKPTDRSVSRSVLHQRMLEGSNVNPIAEMTRLIQASRAYENQLQAVKTFNEIDSKTVNDIAGG